MISYNEILLTISKIYELYPNDYNLNLISDVISVLYFQRTGKRLAIHSHELDGVMYNECLIPEDDELAETLARDVLRTVKALDSEADFEDFEEWFLCAILLK